ncbi:MAG: DUF3090 family protein [Egibacteraceae bacterium]
MGESFELDNVDWITAGAIGEPGRRTFYLQARQGGELVVLLVEKAQVRTLAQLSQELLARVDVTVTPDDLDTTGQALLDPAVPAWRAGSMSLGMDDEGERFLLEAEELPEADEPDEPASARFWMSRDQLIALAAYAAFAVEAGARESCRLCSRPIDPIHGHVCPSMNGHGPLTV